MCLVATLTKRASLPAVRASFPFSRTMLTSLRVFRSTTSHISSINALITIQIFLSSVSIKITSCWIQRYPRIGTRCITSVTARQHVLTRPTSFTRHKIAFFTETCTRLLISVLILTFLSTFADSFVYEEILTGALGALVSRSTCQTSIYSRTTWYTLALILIIAFLTLNTAFPSTLIVEASRDEPTLSALPIAHKPAFRTCGASTSLAKLTVLAESLLTIETLPVILEVSLFAFITCRSILALKTVLIDELRAVFAYTILKKEAKYTSLVTKGISTKQHACP